MRKRIGRWIESVCKEEPKWQEPLEWMTIGFLIAEVIFLYVL